MTESKQKMKASVYEEQKIWEGNEEFFISQRSKIEDLYRSETFFLPAACREVRNCLDVGCACGGFSEIMKTFNPALHYTGIDIIPKFIAIAKKLYPASDFRASDGTKMPFADNTFELVHSTGILHVNSQYREVVLEMYRVSSRYMLCDFRLTEGKEVVGEMDVNLVGQSQAQVLPYYVINKDEHIEFLKSLQPRPAVIDVKGYLHPPTSHARIPLKEICMAFFLVTKGDEKTKTTEIKVNLNA